MARRNLWEYGNGKRHGDPPLGAVRPRKLRCFGVATWKRLKQLTSQGARAKQRQKSESRPETDLRDRRSGKHRSVERTDPNARSRAAALELPEPRRGWWEIEHWDAIYDEERLWGELSLDHQRELKTLLGK
jgi:hypothetical protein